MSRLEAALSEAALAVNLTLDRLVPPSSGPERRVIEAMRYALMGGGKRIRPFLVLHSARLFNVSEASALRAAAAIEMVHCYSLVHDDLPAMDDADLRRGVPSVHKQFDEATAILAGDGLLTQAFEILADPETHGDPLVRANLVLELARASGCAGMVGGQMIDLAAQHATLDIAQVTRLQRMKTGAIIAYSCIAGAVLAKASETARHALVNYANDLGLAFQIADDLLDVVGTEAATGKPVGKDQAAGKATFVALLGVDEARRRARFIADQAAGHLDFFENRADDLKSLAHFVVERRA